MQYAPRSHVLCRTHGTTTLCTSLVRMTVTVHVTVTMPFSARDLRTTAVTMPVTMPGSA